MEQVRAKKYLGQHFLTDKNIAQNIVESLSPTIDNILEVGPGMGVLTNFLLAKTAKNVQVVEIDKESVTYLEEHFPTLKGKIWSEDFLKMDLKNLFSQMPFALIGNFPYNISSQILFKVLENRKLIPEIVGMFQKEVAIRVASPAEKKDYGILSVLLQAYYDIEYLFTVEESVFAPPPKVKSAVIRLRSNGVNHLDCDEELFKRIVKTAFNQRRKTLRNSLKSISFETHFTEEELFNRRPETLNVEEFIYICKHCKKNVESE